MTKGFIEECSKRGNNASKQHNGESVLWRTGQLKALVWEMLWKRNDKYVVGGW